MKNNTVSSWFHRISYFETVFIHILHLLHFNIVELYKLTGYCAIMNNCSVARRTALERKMKIKTEIKTDANTHRLYT